MITFEGPQCMWTNPSKKSRQGSDPRPPIQAMPVFWELMVRQPIPYFFISYISLFPTLQLFSTSIHARKQSPQSGGVLCDQNDLENESSRSWQSCKTAVSLAYPRRIVCAVSIMWESWMRVISAKI